MKFNKFQPKLITDLIMYCVRPCILKISRASQLFVKSLGGRETVRKQRFAHVNRIRNSFENYLPVHSLNFLVDSS